MAIKYEAKDGIITIQDDYIEIRKISLGFQIVNSYKDFIKVNRFKLSEIKEIRIRLASILVQGHISIIAKNEKEPKNNCLSEMNYKYTIHIESKKRNSEAMHFKRILEEHIRD